MVTKPNLTVGVTTPASGDNLTVAEQLALDVGLVESGPDKVLAFLVTGGKIDQHGAFIQQADIGADGKFSIETPRVNPLIELLESCKNADGSFDKAKL